jgi:hypothetical protein
VDLFEDRHHPKHCPVILFVAMALSKGALQLDLEALYKEKEKHIANMSFSSVEFPFSESVLNTPVFRASSFRATNSRDTWSYASASNHLRRLGYRAGFEDILTCYCIRRGAVDKLLRKLADHITHSFALTIIRFGSHSSRGGTPPRSC